MTAATYTRYEMLRTFRSVRFFVFSLGFPLILFLLIAGPNRNEQLDGIPFPVYYMSGMISWGAMMAVIAAGARIAAERSIGWNRQLRLTPLRAMAYFRTKVVTGYAMAVLTIVVLALAGTMLGVRLSFGSWVQMIALILVGLIPFAALGILIGHTLTVDSMGPALGGITAIFGVLGGAWGPVGGGVMHTVAELLPSYWLVQAGRSAVTHTGWPLEAWLVIAVWTLVLTRLAAAAYRRDTKRV